MSALSWYLLSLILNFFPPGKTDSSVVLSEQGAAGATWQSCYHGEIREKRAVFVDPKDPTRARQVKLTMVCRQPAGTPGEWVRRETREEGAKRLEVVAQALADAAEQAPELDQWPEGPRDLGRAGVAVFGWSMGYHEGAEVGRLRGPAGEMSLADLLPATLRQFAPAELKHLSDAELAALVVGLDYDHVRLSFDIGFRVLLAARKTQRWRCKAWHRPEEQLAFAIYVSNYCDVPPPLDWADDVRMHTLERARARKGTTFPDWYVPS